MFIHKKQSSFLLFFVFGAVALGIIISVGILVTMLFSHDRQRDVAPDSQAPSVDIGQDIQAEDNQNTQATSEELVTQYRESISRIVSDTTQSSQSIDNILASVEDTLLAVRVPKDMQEKHLNVVLSVTRLRAQTQQSPAEMRDSVVSLIQSLIAN
ncbi:MAG TPA: hypothetical protein DCS29_01110 [Candidatus Magasanikbacteria bacterium]|nr:MAG: hypothetical protein A2479_02735 [Candidatus Magasanikbacteria bacterium RIFOXYC2_FULL_39_8]HAT03363.1 hypothetical protein [Candidatus Magasanikbacteria bacterium]